MKVDVVELGVDIFKSEEVGSATEVTRRNGADGVHTDDFPWCTVFGVERRLVPIEVGWMGNVFVDLFLAVCEGTDSTGIASGT